MNEQTVRQVFGIAVRIIGLWTLLNGIQTLIAGTVANGNGSAIVLGALVAIVGLGVIKSADNIVRFAYPSESSADQQPPT